MKLPHIEKTTEKKEEELVESNSVEVTVLTIIAIASIIFLLF